MLEAMFNTIYSSNIEPFYVDINSAKQQAEDSVRKTVSHVKTAIERNKWSRDLLRKRVLSAGLELLSIISKQRSGEIYNQYIKPTPSNYWSFTRLSKNRRVIEDEIAQDFFVKLHEQMKVIRSYPRGELYTQKINDHYKGISENQGYIYTPAKYGFDMFRNPRIVDFMLASFLCGQKDEVFDNSDFGSVPQDRAEGKHFTDIVDDRLPAFHRSFMGMRYTMNPPRAPFLKLNNQELDSICSESINTTVNDFGAPINNHPISFDNKTYPNLLHLVLDNIDTEKLQGDQGLIAFREEQKAEVINQLEAEIVEYDKNELQNIVQQDAEDIFRFYQKTFPQSSKQKAEEGEITIEQYQQDIALSRSILEAFQNNDLEYLSQENTLIHYLLYIRVALLSQIEIIQAVDSADFSEITTANLFQQWWEYKIVPSIEQFLELANEKFNSMAEFQFPGPLFQNTVLKMEIASQSTIIASDQLESVNSQQSAESSSDLTHIFPSLVKNNQLNHFISTSPFISASFGGFTATPFPGIIKEHKHILKIPEGVFPNIHFEMTYWADLIVDIAKRKKEIEPDFNVDLTLLRKQLNKLTSLYDVDKMTHEDEQSGKNLSEIRPFNHEKRASSQICTTIDKGTVGGFIKDSFRPIQVSEECKHHYGIFAYYFSSKDSEDITINRCLRMVYLPTTIGEHLGIDINVLYNRRMSTDEEQVSSFFTDRDIYENKSSDSDTLLDQLLKYSLIRLQILEEEVSQAVDMKWRPEASREEAHLLPSTMTMNSQINCDQYTEEFDALIEAKPTAESMTEYMQAIRNSDTPIIPTRDDPVKKLQQLPIVIDLP